jgi:hypothetical protein
MKDERGRMKKDLAIIINCRMPFSSLILPPSSFSGGSCED